MLFLHIDSFVIDKVFEPFSHWWQRLTGMNNFWQARQALMLSFIFSILFVAAEFKNAYLTVCIFISGFFFYGLLYILMIIGEQNYLGRDYLQGGKNPKCTNLLYATTRLVILFLFMFFTCLSLFIIVKINDYHFLFIVGAYTMITAAAYFDSCTPLPPATSKVKEWLIALRRISVLAFSRP
jgi:hypothetical protein